MPTSTLLASQPAESNSLTARTVAGTTYHTCGPTASATSLLGAQPWAEVPAGGKPCSPPPTPLCHQRLAAAPPSRPCPSTHNPLPPHTVPTTYLPLMIPVSRMSKWNDGPCVHYWVQACAQPPQLVSYPTQVRLPSKTHCPSSTTSPMLGSRPASCGSSCMQPVDTAGHHKTTCAGWPASQQRAAA
jgi:hypothetical protein